MKRKILSVFSLFLFALSFSTPVFAASNSFSQKAAEYYDRYCTARSVSTFMSMSCYLYDKVHEVEDSITSQNSKITTIESVNQTQNSRLSDLETMTSSFSGQLSGIPKGLEWVSHQSYQANSSNSFSVNDYQVCPQGKMVISGGAKTTHGETILTWSGPEIIGDSSFPNAWRVKTTNRPSDGTTYFVNTYALCADTPLSE